MLTRHIPRPGPLPWVLALALLAPFPARAHSEAEAFAEALETALADPDAPLSLEVECTDEDGRRSMQLHPSGTLIWNGSHQAEAGEPQRRELLEALQAAAFADFLPGYGGKPSAPEEGAPVMVLCRIEATVAGIAKSSYQDVNGERSEQLMALADRLLDTVEPLGREGLTVASLDQGLAELLAGNLAPEALEVRLMWLPAEGPGVIQDIVGGEIRRRVYQPGVTVGEEETRPLTREALEKLVQALRAAAVGQLPTRLAAPDTCRLRLSVLQHRLNVEARPSAGEPGAEARRLSALVQAALALP